MSVFTGLLFGMAPALQATRPDLASSMKEESRGSSGSAGRKRLRDSLIVAEVALAFVLLVGSGLMMRSFFRLMTVDTGFDATNVLTLRLPTTIELYPDPMRLNQYLQRYPHRGRCRARSPRDGVQLRPAAAGHLLRDADAAGQ